MDKPKINIRAWIPIEKRKANKLYEKNNEPYQNSKEENQDLEHVRKIEDELKGNKYTKYDTDDSKYIEIKYDNNYNKGFNAEKGKTVRNKKLTRKKSSNSNLNIIINSNLIKSIVAGLGAVFAGIIVGYFLLNYFLQPILYDEDIVINKASSNNNIQIETNGKLFPAKTIYFIQAGVFNDINGAEKLLQEQLNSGRNAVIKGSGPYYVYLGYSIQKNDATQIRDSLELQGMETYIKEYTIPDYEINTSDTVFVKLNSFLSSSEELVKQLTQDTLLTINDKNHSIDYEEIQKLHQKYLIDAQKVKEILQQENLNVEYQYIKEMIDNIYYANIALNEYKSSNNSQYLWSIQEHLVKYIINYEELTKI